MQQLVAVLLWFSILGCGVMAGVYFAFSCFAMRAFDRVGPGAAVAAMASINREILRSAFLPLFLATTGVALALTVLALFLWRTAGAVPMLAGGVVYTLGMFICTMVRNVPLNTALVRAESRGVDPAAVWPGYYRDWTRWNHVRTLSCLVATACFTAALDRI